MERSSRNLGAKSVVVGDNFIFHLGKYYALRDLAGLANYF